MGELTHPALLRYLQERGINTDLARLECKELHFIHNGKPYFAIGFPNVAGGFEVRNRFFKGCIAPKDISHICQQGEPREKCLVFEGMMDYLSFLTLRMRNCPIIPNLDGQDYIILNSIANVSKAIDVLHRYERIHCLFDNDEAGQTANKRIADKLNKLNIQNEILIPTHKDWNEDLKGRYGEETIPAQEHPRVMECRAWTEVLKEVTESINIKYANRSYICRYYQDIYNELKKCRGREQLTDAFDGPGMLLTGVLVRCMEKEGIALGRETSADQILENLSKRYQPHKDKGNFNTRIRQMQAAFEETLEVFDTKDLEQKEDQELLARKCMSLAMECIRAHIFVAIDCGEEQMKPAKQTVKEQKMEHQEGGMMLCSQS